MNNLKHQNGLPVKRAINFGAGPAKIPWEVLTHVQSEFLNYKGSGSSICELNHRSSYFADIFSEAEVCIRKLLEVPSSHVILWMHAGGVGQMSAVAMNLSGGKESVCDYIISGTFSTWAATEAEKYTRVNKIEGYVRNDEASWFRDQLTPGASYVYYCDNETIEGIEFPEPPETGGVPLVCDMTSNLFTRKIDFSRFGCIFAATQKNLGIPSLALVIVRRDLIVTPIACTPITMSYKIGVEERCLKNTPPTFALYLTNLILKWIETEGGIVEMEKRIQEKSSLIYREIEDSDGFYKSPISNPRFRSRVTIPFVISESACDDREKVEKQFQEEAKEKHGMIALHGHRFVGGMRTAVYNAVTVDDVKTLTTFMREFKESNQNH